MADYKDIHGTTVRNNDGVLTSAKTGELFYDSTNRNFSYRFPNLTTAGAWRTSTNLNAAKMYLAGAGTNTAALAIGGNTSDPTAVGNTESWNGTSWVEVADLATARGLLGTGGTTSAAFAAGGTTNAGTPGDTNATEEWDLVDTVKTVTVS